MYKVLFCESTRCIATIEDVHIGEDVEKLVHVYKVENYGYQDSYSDREIFLGFANDETMAHTLISNFGISFTVAEDYREAYNAVIKFDQLAYSLDGFNVA